jgi:hypothetical protein
MQRPLPFQRGRIAASNQDFHQIDPRGEHGVTQTAPEKGRVSGLLKVSSSGVQVTTNQRDHAQSTLAHDEASPVAEPMTDLAQRFPIFAKPIDVAT